jgi:thiosulfate/3-mercaptopyruvate sulfurtransferase
MNNKTRPFSPINEQQNPPSSPINERQNLPHLPKTNPIMIQLQHRWVVNAAEAKELIEQNVATVLDVRQPMSWFFSHVPGAVWLGWWQFLEQLLPPNGKLLKDSKILEEKLRRLGICNRKPVIVIGNPPNNFGEEGRVVWMLRTLGHPQAAFVNGGQAALVKIGVPTVWGLTRPAPGDFVVNPTPLWTIQRHQLQDNLTTQAYFVLDSRSPKEFAGATPYCEKRGGHIPGAVHFHFRDLMDKKGYLLPPAEIMTQLHQRGCDRETPIATYCTGGVRSAFIVAVLTELGYTCVKNYPGSIWEWSAYPAITHPLNRSC